MIVTPGYCERHALKPRLLKLHYLWVGFLKGMYRLI
jgi:hypothetical protein